MKRPGQLAGKWRISYQHQPEKDGGGLPDHTHRTAGLLDRDTNSPCSSSEWHSQSIKKGLGQQMVQSFFSTNLG